jgi:hypothetical protein
VRLRAGFGAATNRSGKSDRFRESQSIQRLGSIGLLLFESLTSPALFAASSHLVIETSSSSVGLPGSRSFARILSRSSFSTVDSAATVVLQHGYCFNSVQH